MNDLVYCGFPPVGSDETQGMLVGEYRALWSPPMHRHALPAAGDRVWLVWRGASQDPTLLLGGGVIEATAEGKVEWTNRTAPGIVAAARAAGYSGPTNMAFLRLADVRVPSTVLSIQLGDIRVGLSQLTPEQSALLRGALPLE
jgi:hypothetical protein